MKIASLLVVTAAALTLTACGATPAPVEQSSTKTMEAEAVASSPAPSTPSTPSSPEKVEELRSYLTATYWESISTEGTAYAFNDDGTISTVIAGVETTDPADVWSVDAPSQLTLTFFDGDTASVEVTAVLPEPAELSETTELHLEGSAGNHGIDSEVSLDLTLAGTSDR